MAKKVKMIKCKICHVERTSGKHLAHLVGGVCPHQNDATALKQETRKVKMKSRKDQTKRQGRMK